MSEIDDNFTRLATKYIYLESDFAEQEQENKDLKDKIKALIDKHKLRGVYAESAEYVLAYKGLFKDLQELLEDTPDE